MEERFIRVPRTARFYVLGNAQSATRLWFVLHGYGQLARYFLNKFEGLNKHLLIVAPEGLSRFYTDAAHQRVGATWMTRENRENEIKDQIDYLDQLAATLKLEMASEAKIGVLGFSQGVATACRWIMAGRTPIDRLIIWGGNIPPELDRNALRSKYDRVHVDVVQGATDKVVPVAIAEQSIGRLASAGIIHAMHMFQGGHELDPVLLKRCLAV